jgi:hypothetical protein
MHTPILPGRIRKAYSRELKCFVTTIDEGMYKIKLHCQPPYIHCGPVAQPGRVPDFYPEKKSGCLGFESRRARYDIDAF